MVESKATDFAAYGTLAIVCELQGFALPPLKLCDPRKELPYHGAEIEPSGNMAAASMPPRKRPEYFYITDQHLLQCKTTPPEQGSLGEGLESPIPYLLAA